VVGIKRGIFSLQFHYDFLITRIFDLNWPTYNRLSLTLFPNFDVVQDKKNESVR